MRALKGQRADSSSDGELNMETAHGSMLKADGRDGLLKRLRAHRDNSHAMLFLLLEILPT